jgi:heme iron utilization protein
MKNFENLANLIKSVLDQQRFAVLATQSEGQPYSNLVAFAEAESLKILLYVTGRATRKYANSLSSNKVAILVDNRTNQVTDLNTAVAITALGIVEEVIEDDKERLMIIYLSKHPELQEFLQSPSNALMKVTVYDYMVATFDGVERLSVINSK